MIGNSNYETNFPHKSLLTNRQVANLRKAFANYTSTDIKLSKTQPSTKPARDVLGMSPEGPLKVLMPRTSRGPSMNSQGTNTKINDLMKKIFLDAMVLVLHICSCFLLEKQIFKRSKLGCPWDVYGTQLRDVPGTKWWNVLRTSAGGRQYMFFKFNSQTY